MPTCILTTKDVTILEVMFERLPGADNDYGRLLKRKLDTARVVLREDVPANVATLNSRVSFCIDHTATDSRVISQDQMNSPIGSFLPITTLRGLALLGLSVGQTFLMTTDSGRDHAIELTAVLHQPEAARRKKPPMGETHTRPPPFLRLVVGGREPVREQVSLVDFDDDPGPAAA
ncbi:MAG: nucleoside-diphosphate kinase [Mesorhizobium sp.]